MDKFTYFTSALHAGCAGRTHWVTSCFSAMTHEVYDPGKHKLVDDDAPKLIRDQAITYQFRISASIKIHMRWVLSTVKMKK